VLKARGRDSSASNIGVSVILLSCLNKGGWDWWDVQHAGGGEKQIQHFSSKISRKTKRRLKGSIRTGFYWPNHLHVAACCSFNDNVSVAMTTMLTDERGSEFVAVNISDKYKFITIPWQRTECEALWRQVCTLATI